MSIYDNPLTLADSRRYAAALRRLLASLDREVVDAALFGESESDFLDAEREEVDRFREFLNGRVLVPLQLDGLRGRGLALLDGLGDEFASSEHGSPLTVAPVLDAPVSSTPTVGGAA